jgi:hypothetical protein
MKTWAIVNSENQVVNCIAAETLEVASLSVNGVVVDEELVIPENPEFAVIEYFMVEPNWTYLDGVFTPPTE